MKQIVPPLKPRQLVIYCDESDDKGKFFSHFYGGLAVDDSKREALENELQATKDRLNFQGEAKWSKIGPGHEARYIGLIDAFFDCVANKRIKVRIMFTQNIYSAEDLDDYQTDNQYFILYYHFVKHAFGLQHANPIRDRKLSIQLRFDEFPESRDRCENFKRYLSSLSNFPPFAEARVVFPISEIAQIDSSTHILSQCLDIVLGAMQFKLNDKHKEKPKGARRRGKRTIAKENVYKHINRRIRQIYPNFNVGTNTARPERESTWKHEYRHWNFTPTNAKINKSYTPKRR